MENECVWTREPMKTSQLCRNKGKKNTRTIKRKKKKKKQLLTVRAVGGE